MNAVGEYAVNQYGLIKMTKAPKGFRDPVVIKKPEAEKPLASLQAKKEDKAINAAISALGKMTLSGTS